MPNPPLLQRLGRRLRQAAVNLNPRRFDVRVLASTAANRPAAQGEVAVFNHYDPAGDVAAYVLAHLRALQGLGLSLVFVSTAPHLSAAALQQLGPLCWQVLLRPNRGLDLGGWPAAVRRIEAELGLPLHQGLSRVVMANDSVFGPLLPLRPVFDAMSAGPGDIWGITESTERAHHLQSYFVVFEQPALAFLRDWLQTFQFLEDRDALIIRFEIGLSQAARARGLQLAALVTLDALGRIIGEQAALSEGAAAATVPDRHLRVNPTHAYWRETIQFLGSPYIKRDLIRDFPRFDDGRGSWRAFLSAYEATGVPALIDIYFQPAAR